MFYSCARENLWFEHNREFDGFPLKCEDDGSFEDLSDEEWLNCVPSRQSKYCVNGNSCQRLFVSPAVFCDPPPEKPRGGKYVWSRNTTFGTTVEYSCGKYAKFLAPNSTDFYESLTITCQWNKTWTRDLDPCICKLFCTKELPIQLKHVSDSHCNVIPEPLDFTGLTFVPDNATRHLFVLDDTSVYNPSELPTSITSNQGFGIDKDLMLDGIVHDIVSSNPVVRVIDDQGKTAVKLEIDVSFSNLIITSEMTVRTL